jgi:hypothetical protein
MTTHHLVHVNPCPRCANPYRHGHIYEVNPPLAGQAGDETRIVICTNEECLNWDWILPKIDHASVTKVRSRPRCRFYIYERISHKNYRLRGTIQATDTFDAQSLWFGTKIYRVTRSKRFFGVAQVRMADKKMRVPAKVIEPHFSHTYYGW